MILNLDCTYSKIYTVLSSSPNQTLRHLLLATSWGSDIRAAQVIIMHTSGHLRYLLASQGCYTQYGHPFSFPFSFSYLLKYHPCSYDHLNTLSPTCNFLLGNHNLCFICRRSYMLFLPQSSNLFFEFYSSFVYLCYVP